MFSKPPYHVKSIKNKPKYNTFAIVKFENVLTKHFKIISNGIWYIVYFWGFKQPFKTCSECQDRCGHLVSSISLWKFTKKCVQISKDVLITIYINVQAIISSAYRPPPLL